MRLFSFGGHGLALVVFGAYDSYPKNLNFSTGSMLFFLLLEIFVDVALLVVLKLAVPRSRV